MNRKVTCACGCGTKFIAADSRRKYLDERHRKRDFDSTPAGRARKKRQVARIQARVDLTCVWCQAKSTETKWSKTLSTCLACARARPRCACPKCGAPVSLEVARGWCVTCDPKPKGSVEVILLDAGSDRERTVWRRPNHAGWVSVGLKDVKVTSDPMVVTLPTAKWIRTRR